MRSEIQMTSQSGGFTENNNRHLKKKLLSVQRWWNNQVKKNLFRNMLFCITRGWNDIWLIFIKSTIIEIRCRRLSDRSFGRGSAVGAGLIVTLSSPTPLSFWGSAWVCSALRNLSHKKPTYIDTYWKWCCAKGPGPELEQPLLTFVLQCHH